MQFMAVVVDFPQLYCCTAVFLPFSICNNLWQRFMQIQRLITAAHDLPPAKTVGKLKFNKNANYPKLQSARPRPFRRRPHPRPFD